MKELNEDEKDLVRDFMTSQAWKPFVKLMIALESRLGAQVLGSNIESGDREIVLAKARLDGAKSLIAGIERAKRDLVKGDR